MRKKKKQIKEQKHFLKEIDVFKTKIRGLKETIIELIESNSSKLCIS